MAPIAYTDLRCTAAGCAEGRKFSFTLLTTSIRVTAIHLKQAGVVQIALYKHIKWNKASCESLSTARTQIKPTQLKGGWNVYRIVTCVNHTVGHCNDQRYNYHTYSLYSTFILFLFFFAFIFAC